MTTLLSPAQYERLCCLVYLDEILDYCCSLNLHDICNNILPHIKQSDKLEADNKQVLTDIMTDEKLSDLTIADFMDIPLSYGGSDQTPGQRIVTFTDGINGYIIIRGTHGDVQWADNGRRMYKAETPELLQAESYVLKQAEKFRKVGIAGHSGGGNKVQYIYIKNPVIAECLALDGEGFSIEFCEKYPELIDARAQGITSIAERRDIVNGLGITLSLPLYFSGKRGETRLPEYFFGEPLPNFHIPDALRNKDNEIIDQAERSYISELINAITVFLLTSPEYASRKQFLCDTLVSLMMTETKTDKNKQALAIAEVVSAAFEIASNDKEFTELFRDTLINERRVIRATIAEYSEAGIIDLIKGAMHHTLHKYNPNKTGVEQIANALPEITKDEPDGLFEKIFKDLKEIYSF
ncbi:MAG: hypothetical protein LBM87_05755 [Ruminococcus sp.]|jgi:hypothetical protein|nr:hypothetical protein [Ruminococcus sp.]